MNLTTFLNDHYQNPQLSQRIWHIKNNNFEIQKCKICGNNVEYCVKHSTYHRCCNSCTWNKENITDFDIVEFYYAYGKILPKKSKYMELLILSTSFLDKIYDKIPPAQRIWHIENQNFEIQTCKVCKNPVKWGNSHNKHTYSTYCGKDCADIFFNSEQYHMECKQICLERYGVDNYAKTQEYKEKRTDTSIRKYGVENYCQTPEYKEKYKQTCLEKYGVENYHQSDEFKQKSKKTCLEKYGVDNYTKTDEYEEKSKQTCLEKYGVDSHSKTKEFTDKIKQTSIRRYGQDSYSKTDEAKKRAVERSKWFGLLRQGIGDAIYLKHLDSNNHLLKCKICGYEFELCSANSRIHNGHALCPQCNPIKKPFSSSEKELLSFISSIYSGPIQENSRSVIPPYEVDIFLPELSLAFEYNDVYWHSSDNVHDDYHKIKTELCEQAGVRLVHIFEDDWNYKQEIMKSILQNMIHPQNNHKIFARKCRIEKIDLSETNDFLEQNHIQGSVLIQTVCYGLYCDDDLVSLMSFKKNKSRFELQRYGIKLGHTIIGGAEKLWSYFLKNHNPEFVITYADISLFTGRVYQKLGFQKVRRNKPNYMFVDKGVRIPKQSIRKLGQGYKRQNDPYPRIYNCGIDVWEYK